jgi:hypothetical protein
VSHDCGGAVRAGAGPFFALPHSRELGGVEAAAVLASTCGSQARPWCPPQGLEAEPGHVPEKVILEDEVGGISHLGRSEVARSRGKEEGAAFGMLSQVQGHWRPCWAHWPTVIPCTPDAGRG